MRKEIQLTNSELKKIDRFSEKVEKYRTEQLKLSPETYNQRLKERQFGFRGEYAVAKYMKWNFNWEIYPDKGDEGHDFTINNYNIDVKSSSYDPPFLRAYIDLRDFKSDYYILVYHQNNYFQHICGWISFKEFLEKKEEGRVGYKGAPRAFVKEESLYNIDSFKIELQQKEKIQNTLHNISNTDIMKELYRRLNIPQNL